MGMFILHMFILHLFLMIVTIANAVFTKDNVSRVLWIISSVCWTLLFIGDIVELVLM